MTIEQIQQRWNPEFDFGITYYLSGPMSGYPDYNYEAFRVASGVLRETGVTLESPHENEWPDGHEAMDPSDLWGDMMEKALSQMEKCNGIILLKGWPQSKGARQELMIGMKLNWPIWYYHDFQLINMNRSQS